MSHCEDEKISFLTNIGMLMTYRCQLACSHCVVEAGPHRTEEIDLEEAFRWIAQISAYRDGHIRGLSLTGGEPFYSFDKLKAIADCGGRAGLVVTTVTNAFWATTVDNAVRTLEKIPSLRMIGISSDVHHQKEIPLERVINAIYAARKLNLPFRVLVAADSGDCEAQRQILSRLSDLVPDDHIQKVATFLAGRAASDVDASKFAIADTPCKSRCAAAGAPVIFPGGRVIACIGALIALPNPHPLVLGNLRTSTLREILDNSESNPVLHTLRIWGPHKLVSMLEGKYPKERLPANYVADSICDACYKIMSADHLSEKIKQIAGTEDYMREVAYGRAYHLNEIEMLQCLG